MIKKCCVPDAMPVHTKRKPCGAQRQALQSVLAGKNTHYSQFSQYFLLISPHPFVEMCTNLSRRKVTDFVQKSFCIIPHQYGSISNRSCHNYTFCPNYDAKIAKIFHYTAPSSGNQLKEHSDLTFQYQIAAKCRHIPCISETQMPLKKMPTNKLPTPSTSA